MFNTTRNDRGFFISFGNVYTTDAADKAKIEEALSGYGILSCEIGGTAGNNQVNVRFHPDTDEKEAIGTVMVALAEGIFAS